MPSQANQPLPEGSQLENYRILRVLATGGFSFVYLAHDENDAPVAIKEYLPSTLAVREYALPDAKARPRRIAIDGDDIVWYADFARGYLGRLDPATGAVKEWPSPSGPRSGPYGIVFTKGAVWYNESGAKPNTIVRFDPKSEQFQTWLIPSGGYIVRKMDVTPDGNPVMVNSTVNFVGMVEVK